MTIPGQTKVCLHLGKPKQKSKKSAPKIDLNLADPDYVNGKPNWGPRAQLSVPQSSAKSICPDRWHSQSAAEIDRNRLIQLRSVGWSARSPAPRRVRPAVGGVQCGERRGAAPLGARRLDGTGPGSDFLSY